MTMLTVVRIDEKQVGLRGVEPFVAQCLFGLPEILAGRERPEVRGRFFQDPLPGDEATNAEWHKLVDSDLHHLFAGAGEIITRDLTGWQGQQVVFPAVHLPAWLSALNQARLILGEMYHVSAQDMERANFEPGNAKDEALVRIHVLGYLLQLFVELES